MPIGPIRVWSPILQGLVLIQVVSHNLRRAGLLRTAESPWSASNIFVIMTPIITISIINYHPTGATKTLDRAPLETSLLCNAPEREADLLGKMKSSIMHGTSHGMDNLKVHSVQLIENERLWREYTHQRGLFERHDGMEVLTTRQNVKHWLDDAAGEQYPHVIDAQANEVWLWHGTKPDTAKIIAERGFDEREARLEGMYGAGNYFADCSSKSHQYARPHTNEDGHMHRMTRYLRSI
jgi:hypothetical protein